MVALGKVSGTGDGVGVGVGSTSTSIRESGFILRRSAPPMVRRCTKGRWGESSMFSIARVQWVSQVSAYIHTCTPGCSRASGTCGSPGASAPGRR